MTIIKERSVIVNPLEDELENSLNSIIKCDRILREQMKAGFYKTTEYAYLYLGNQLNRAREAVEAAKKNVKPIK